MSSFLILLPLVLSFAGYAALIKLAAKLYQRSRIPWKHALLFGVLAVLLGRLGVIFNFATGYNLEPLPGAVIAVAIYVTVSGRYLGRKATAFSGESVGFKGGVTIAAIAFGFAFVLGILLATVVAPNFTPASQA